MPVKDRGSVELLFRVKVQCYSLASGLKREGYRIKLNSKLCCRLAELFFLDTEPSQREFEQLAISIREEGWSRQWTEKILIELIAPHAGANLGFLIYPVIGEWEGFNEEKLFIAVCRSYELRSKKPVWYFMISDWWCRRMLISLEMNRLLDLLS